MLALDIGRLIEFPVPLLTFITIPELSSPLHISNLDIYPTQVTECLLEKNVYHQSALFFLH